MKKFTILTEKLEKKRFKVNINVNLIIETEDEGEAGYIADDIIATIENLKDYQILNIEQTIEKIDEKNKK